MKQRNSITDDRLAVLLQFYQRHWPDGELARALQELVDRRGQDEDDREDTGRNAKP